MDDQGDGYRLEAASGKLRAPLGGGEGQRLPAGVAEVDRRFLDHLAVGEYARPGDAAPFVPELPGVEGAAVHLDQGATDSVLEFAEVGGDRLGAGLAYRRRRSHGAGISASASPTAVAKPASASSSCARDRKPTSYAEGASM